MPIKYWRQPEKIERLMRLERPGFAAEFLRRNDDYRRDYTRMLRHSAVDAHSTISCRWGLRFPL